MQIYQTRQEHDFFKLLAKNIKELSKVVEGNEKAEEIIKETIGLCDGYLIASRERIREEDV